MGQLRAVSNHSTPGGAHLPCLAGAAALAHVQFETSTPSSTAMADWAGLLIVLMLIDAEVSGSCQLL